MNQQIKVNLNNLHKYYSALGAEASLGVSRHIGWPNKVWRNDFSQVSTEVELKSQRLVSVEPLAETSNFELKSQLVMMNLQFTTLKPVTDCSTTAVISEIRAGELEQWVAACGRAFGYQIESESIGRLLPDNNATLLAYRINGEIAGTAIGYKTGNTLGVHQVGVVPDFRGQGLARKLMLELIQLAQRQECTTVSLQASKAGLPLYEQLGFKQLGPIFQFG